ncbi:YARHG domain-containing protein [Tenacibaculum xiamenense]|uniref:YARHG domain-containing protein n=1 Tax=Tenacibaculum xiamenense TaxID=1261553 RepID=UPI00389309CC
MNKLIPLLILFSTIGFAQVLSDIRIDESKLIQWKTENINNYEGSYNFGFSEGESKVTFVIQGGIICAQLSYHEWSSNTKNGWLPKYKNYTNVRIKDNKFFSKESNGEFVFYEGRKCLKLENPHIQMGEEGEYELGEKSINKLSDEQRGKYNYTFYKIVNENELKALSLKELQIMRNEIFARYHYIFKKGGEMDIYFNKQDWYYGFNKDVNHLLTKLEKINLMKIKKVETAKKN